MMSAKFMVEKDSTIMKRIFKGRQTREMSWPKLRKRLNKASTPLEAKEKISMMKSAHSMSTNKVYSLQLMTLAFGKLELKEEVSALLWWVWSTRASTLLRKDILFLFCLPHAVRTSRVLSMSKHSKRSTWEKPSKDFVLSWVEKWASLNYQRWLLSISLTAWLITKSRTWKRNHGWELNLASTVETLQWLRVQLLKTKCGLDWSLESNWTH